MTKFFNYQTFRNDEQMFKHYVTAFQMLFNEGSVFASTKYKMIYIFTSKELTVKEIVLLFEKNQIGGVKAFEGILQEINPCSLSGYLPKVFFDTKDGKDQFSDFEDVLVKAREEEKGSLTGAVAKMKEELNKD